MKEKTIEQTLVMAVRSKGGLCPKWVSPGLDGVPDRLILFPGGHMAFAELEEQAKIEQRNAMEQDDREGLVQEYLDMLLPEGWENMDVYKRRNYVSDTSDPMRAVGVHRRDEVSNIEIWCECFGKPREDMKPSDSYAIAAIMAHLQEWGKPEKRKSQSIYGRQRVYTRIK